MRKTFLKYSTAAVISTLVVIAVLFALLRSYKYTSESAGGQKDHDHQHEPAGKSVFSIRR